MGIPSSLPPSPSPSSPHLTHCNKSRCQARGSDIEMDRAVEGKGKKGPCLGKRIVERSPIFALLCLRDLSPSPSFAFERDYDEVGGPAVLPLTQSPSSIFLTLPSFLLCRRLASFPAFHCLVTGPSANVGILLVTKLKNIIQRSLPN